METRDHDIIQILIFTEKRHFPYKPNLHRFHQVALGNVKSVDDRDYYESAPEGFDSVLLTSSEVPDPSEDVTTPYGAVVPAGVRITQNSEVYNSHSEYVVYKESQVLIRYIVQLKTTRRSYQSYRF